ncbi:MAG: NnrS family protein [Alphaproteobacteria bacterium]
MDRLMANLSNQDRLNLRRDYTGPLFLKEGFRPMFIGAGTWAAVAVPLWICVWSGHMTYPGAFDPAVWHVHEMIYGFVAAAVGGFMLTAIPNWTGRLPVRGAPLAVLATLWLAGRIAVWFGTEIGPVAAAAIDLSYLTMLGFVVANEIIAGKNWRNAPLMGGVLLLLLAGNLLFHLDAMGVAATVEIATRLSVSVVIMLISVIGGRIVPSFTRNWFARNDGPEIASPMMPFDKLTLGVSVAAFILWIALADTEVSGVALALAGICHLIRLSRWRGWQTLGEGLVTVLHVAYLWVGVGLVLLGLSAVGSPVPQTGALHVLTIGAMATMILAVMTRAVRGHTGRELTAGTATNLIYFLVTAALVLRFTNEFVPAAELVWIAAAAWTGGFVLFLAVHAPMVVRRPKAV